MISTFDEGFFLYQNITFCCKNFDNELENCLLIAA